MYLRRTQRRRKDGSVVGYVQLAHNRRVGGVTRAEVLLNLGREDELDIEGLRRLAASITRYTDGDGALAPLGGGGGGGEGELVVQSSRALGGVAAERALAPARRRRGAGAGPRPAAVHDGRRAGAVRDGRQQGARPVLEARLLGVGDPGRPIPGLPEFDEDQCYRAMDLLVEADAEARSRRRCSSAVLIC